MGQQEEAFRLLLRAISHEGGTFFALGRTDVGKTTLLQGLSQLVLAVGQSVAVLDGDMGQSTYGLPTTLNLMLLRPPSTDSGQAGANAKEERVASYFVGSTSPVGHLLQTVVGCKRLLEKTPRLGVKTIFIDTTGLVEGPLAVEFKLQKIDLLAPTHILALARGEELDPILGPCQTRGSLVVHRLPVSNQARLRSPEERRDNRRRKYAAYFCDLKPNHLSLKDVAVWGKVPQTRAEALEGLLLGLNDAGNFCLGLGLLTGLNADKGTVEFLSPLSSLAEVKCLRFGSLRIDPLGNEQVVPPHRL
jgi:polynucleotide 5'-hydroxyl-kinase GRC3/NOL9